MNKQYRWTLLILWIVTGTVRAADEAPDKRLYSLAPGSRWSYDERLELIQVSGSETNLTHVTGTVDEEILQAPAHYSEKGELVLSRSTVKEQRESNGRLSEASGGYVQLLEWRQGDLYVHGTRVWVDGSYSEDMNLYQPPLPYLKGAARAGENWTVGTQKNMGTEMPTTATMAGAETIVVPAGTFSNCLKVVYTSTKTSGTIGTPNGSLRVADGNVQDTVWYAKDVGIVKESQMSLTTYATKQGRIFNREEQTKLLRSHTPAK